MPIFLIPYLNQLTPFVLAIDIGTTSTKALAVHPHGQVLRSHQCFYPTHYPKPGYAEQDPIQILEAVKESMIQALKDIPFEFQLAGICFSSAMHSLVAVNVKGEPLSPLIIWADTRSSEQAYQLRQTETGNRLHDQTGTPIHPMSPLCKLLWWKKHEPGLLGAHKFISIKEFVIYQLCGEFLIDYSIASATGLFDINALQWSGEALELIGINKEKLSEPVSIYHKIYINSRNGNLPESVSLVPCFLGGSDGCLAQLGSDAMKDGDLTITLGTSGAVRRVGGKESQDLDRKLFRYLLDADTLIVGGATNNGTVVVDWFGREFVAPDTKLEGMGKLAAEIPAGCDGLVALPFLLGERAPIYNPDARGVFFNISLRHTKAHFVRALMEGICFELLTIVKSVELSCGRSIRIFISGGFTHSKEWVQMLASILGKQLIVSGDFDASAMGAARVAFHALQLPFHLNISDQVTYKPIASQRELYDRQFEVFESLYKQLENQFGRV